MDKIFRDRLQELRVKARQEDDILTSTALHIAIIQGAQVARMTRALEQIQATPCIIGRLPIDPCDDDKCPPCVATRTLRTNDAENRRLGC